MGVLRGMCPLPPWPSIWPLLVVATWLYKTVMDAVVNGVGIGDYEALAVDEWLTGTAPVAKIGSLPMPFLSPSDTSPWVLQANAAQIQELEARIVQLKAEREVWQCMVQEA